MYTRLFVFLSAFFITLSLATDAQKLRSEDISYTYTRLPSAPVKNITNYQVVFEAAYEIKNRERQIEYEQKKLVAQEKYSKDMALYSGLVKEADARYERELAEYNKKSLGTKIVEKSMLDNGKPVRQVIPKPYIERVEEPQLYSSYDYKVMADTYVKVEGFNNDPSSALKALVILYGFDFTQPRSISEETTKSSSGSSGTYKTSVYHNEFSYRHPMALKVYMPDGKEVLSVTPPTLNSYKIYKGPVTDKPQTINRDLLIRNLEEKTLQENLAFINNLLNDKFGYSAVQRKGTFYYVKTDDAIYADLVTAFNEASSGLLMLIKDKDIAGEKLNKSIAIWNNALKESDPGNKRSRIDKDMTIAVCFDLLEAYFALGDAQGGQKILERMNTLNLTNNDRKTKLDFDVLFADLKKRQSQIN